MLNEARLRALTEFLSGLDKLSETTGVNITHWESVQVTVAGEQEDGADGDAVLIALTGAGYALDLKAR